MADNNSKATEELKQKSRVLLGMSEAEFLRTPPWKIENMLDQLGPSRVVTTSGSAPVVSRSGPLEIERLAAEVQCLKHSHLYSAGSTVKAAVADLLADRAIPEEGKRLLKTCQAPDVSAVGLQSKLADAIKNFIIHEEALDVKEASIRSTYVKEFVPAIAYFQQRKTERDAHIEKFKRYLKELCDTPNKI